MYETFYPQEARRELPEDLRPARGILIGVLLGLAFWIASALVLVKFAYAGDGWDMADKSLGGAALASTLADWSQSRYIAKHPNEFSETNVILGKHPTVGMVDTYFAGSIALGYLITDWLSPGYRKAVLGGVTFVEIGYVDHNMSLGIGWGF